MLKVLWELFMQQEKMCAMFAQDMEVLQAQVDDKQSKGVIPLRTQYEDVAGAEAGTDRHRPWRSSKQRDAAEPELAAVLRKVCSPHVLVPASHLYKSVAGVCLDLVMSADIIS